MVILGGFFFVIVPTILLLAIGSIGNVDAIRRWPTPGSRHRAPPATRGARGRGPVDPGQLRPRRLPVRPDRRGRAPHHLHRGGRRRASSASASGAPASSSPTPPPGSRRSTWASSSPAWCPATSRPSWVRPLLADREHDRRRQGRRLVLPDGVMAVVAAHLGARRSWRSPCRWCCGCRPGEVDRGGPEQAAGLVTFPLIIIAYGQSTGALLGSGAPILAFFIGLVAWVIAFALLSTGFRSLTRGRRLRRRTLTNLPTSQSLPSRTGHRRRPERRRIPRRKPKPLLDKRPTRRGLAAGRVLPEGDGDGPEQHDGDRDDRPARGADHPAGTRTTNLP